MGRALDNAMLNVGMKNVAKGTFTLSKAGINTGANRYYQTG